MEKTFIYANEIHDRRNLHKDHGALLHIALPPTRYFPGGSYRVAVEFRSRSFSRRDEMGPSRNVFYSVYGPGRSGPVCDPRRNGWAYASARRIFAPYRKCDFIAEIHFSDGEQSSMRPIISEKIQFGNPFPWRCLRGGGWWLVPKMRGPMVSYGDLLAVYPPATKIRLSGIRKMR